MLKIIIFIGLFYLIRRIITSYIQLQIIKKNMQNEEAHHNQRRPKDRQTSTHGDPKTFNAKYHVVSED